MQMTLKPAIKPVLAAVLALAMAGAAQAAGGNLGAPAPSASFSDTINGSFNDVWTFTLPEPSFVAASLTNVEILIGNLTTGGILGFSAVLEQVPLDSSLNTSTTGGLTINTLLLTGNTALPAGTYSLIVSGTGITGGSASYGGNIVVTPVPEPAGYALLLAGLGAVGAIARRRRSC